MFAWENAKRIKKDKPIPHWLNGLVHFLIWAIFHKLFHSEFVAVLPFIARLFFDFPLNIFRGLDSGYVPENPKALSDKVEKFIFGDNGITPKVLYVWIILISIIIQNDLYNGI